MSKKVSSCTTGGWICIVYPYRLLPRPIEGYFIHGVAAGEVGIGGTSNFGVYITKLVQKYHKER